MSQILAKRGDFSLRKCYESYIKSGKKFNCSEAVKMDGKNDESLSLYLQMLML